MVTFCLGSARQKRAYFKDSDMIVLDNIEVLFCVSENGRNYFAYGPVPFSEFSVRDYIKYKRALCGGMTDFKLIEKLNIPLDKRVGRLCQAEMRGVMLAEKIGGGEANKPVVINLDGTKYSRKNMRALTKLISVCGDVYVLVTDKRFELKFKQDGKRLNFGKPDAKSRMRFYRAAILGKKIGASKISVM